MLIGAPYYRARYYDPQAGRFINEDPIRFKGGANFYAYTEDNPVTATDPAGLCDDGLKPKPKWCHAVAGLRVATRTGKAGRRLCA